jgi:predicted Zn-dependent protease with MMP-like domain
MDINEFEKIITEAAESLPENIKKAMANIAIVVEEKPIKNDLLGLYQGIPENQWGKNETIRLPDKITIFKSAIENQARTSEQIKELVRVVVWHEIAHHFGFDEPGARELERKWASKRRDF